MKLCNGCEPEACATTFSVNVNRANLCQWVTGFARAWWNGQKTVTLTLHTQALEKVVVRGETVYSSETVSAEHPSDDRCPHGLLKTYHCYRCSPRPE